MKDEVEIVGEVAAVRARIVSTCLHLARIGRPDIPWTERVVEGRRDCEVIPNALRVICNCVMLETKPVNARLA